jgi:hypothetical protein
LRLGDTRIDQAATGALLAALRPAGSRPRCGQPRSSRRITTPPLKPQPAIRTDEDTIALLTRFVTHYDGGAVVGI